MTQGSQSVTETKELAKVGSLDLGFEDHGILGFNLNFEGEAWGQGTGWYATAHSTRDDKKCWGNAMTMFVGRVLETLGVERVEEVGGQMVYVIRDKDRIIGFETTGIGNKRRRFDFRTELEAMPGCSHR